MGLKQTIKGLDAFPRAEDHLLQKTQTGAVGNMRGHASLFVFYFYDVFLNNLCFLSPVWWSICEFS